MSKKTYTPTPVFDTLEDVIDQYKAIYAAPQAHHLISQWLIHCFFITKTDIPNFAIKDY